MSMIEKDEYLSIKNIRNRLAKIAIKCDTYLDIKTILVQCGYNEYGLNRYWVFPGEIGGDYNCISLLEMMANTEGAFKAIGYEVYTAAEFMKANGNIKLNTGLAGIDYQLRNYDSVNQMLDFNRICVNLPIEEHWNQIMEQLDINPLKLPFNNEFDCIVFDSMYGMFRISTTQAKALRYTIMTARQYYYLNNLSLFKFSV